MRQLKTSDIFKMSKILKKMGLKKEIDVGEKTQSQVGAEFIITIFENLHLAEKEINTFLAELTDMTVEEFENQDMEKTIELINELKGKVNFFKLASL